MITIPISEDTSKIPLAVLKKEYRLFHCEEHEAHISRKQCRALRKRGVCYFCRKLDERPSLKLVHRKSPEKKRGIKHPAGRIFCSCLLSKRQGKITYERQEISQRELRPGMLTVASANTHGIDPTMPCEDFSTEFLEWTDFRIKWQTEIEDV